jgi:hypothetical protein
MVKVRQLNMRIFHIKYEKVFLNYFLWEVKYMIRSTTPTIQCFLDNE